jgi:hypothetical protein
MRRAYFFETVMFLAALAIIQLTPIGAFPPTRADGAVTSSDDPSAVQERSPLRAPLRTPQGTNPLGSGKVYFSDCNSFGPTTPFYEYDVATNTWTQRAFLPAANTTQLASDERGNVHALPEDGKVYRYNSSTDSWVFVMDGPPASVGRNNVSMFETHNGTFYWGRDFTTTLYYTVGGVWNAIETPRALSAGSAVDRGTGRIYIRTVGELGFFAFEPASATFPQICDVGGGVSEDSRVGAFFDGEFFSRDFAGAYQAIDVSTCAVSDTGVAPASVHSATDEDEVGNIYSNGWEDETIFEVFNVPTNTLTRLADAPEIPENAHSTLVAVRTISAVISVTLDIKPRSFPNSINPKSNGVIPVAILTTDTFDATTVDPLSVRFGPKEAKEAHNKGHLEDVNKDNRLDLVLHFSTKATGIQCGDTSASLTGETFDGDPIEGTDSIKTVGCKK